MITLAFQNVSLAEQTVCPKDQFHQLLKDDIDIWEKDIETPSWWTMEEFDYTEVVETGLCLLTVICYKLAVTDYTHLVFVHDQDIGETGFAEQMARIGKEDWTPFSPEDLMGMSDEQIAASIYSQPCNVSYKEFEGTLYVWTSLADSNLILKKA